MRRPPWCPVVPALGSRGHCEATKNAAVGHQNPERALKRHISMVECVWGREEERARQKGRKRPRTSPNWTSGACRRRRGAPGRWRRRKRAKWPVLDGTFSAVADDSDPVQRRPRACRKRPRAARLSRRAGPETEHGKSSPGSPQIPVQDILYGVSLRRPGHGPPPRPRARHPAGPSERPWGPRGTPRGLNDASGPPASGEPGAGSGAAAKVLRGALKDAAGVRRGGLVLGPHINLANDRGCSR